MAWKWSSRELIALDTSPRALDGSSLSTVMMVGMQTVVYLSKQTAVSWKTSAHSDILISVHKACAQSLGLLPEVRQAAESPVSMSLPSDIPAGEG